MTENFYDLLGVAEDASTAAIEEAYREEIKQVHPDVSDDVDAGERTKRLNKAKRVLTDEDERARYDRQGHETYTSGGPTDGSGASGATGTSADPTGTDSTGADSTAGDTRARESSEYSGGSTGGSYGRQRRGRRTGATAGRADRPGSGSAAGSAHRSGSVSEADDPWPGRDGRRGTGQGRSAGSTGPSWQSSRAQATATGSGGAAGPSARRQAAAGTTDGPNAESSWNAWEQTRSWAVRQGQADTRSVTLERFLPTQQSMLLLVSTFFFYPLFVASALYPPFPVVAQLVVGTCTLLMFGYLLSVPETAVTVFGLWSILAPVALLAIPGIGLFSVVGVVALSLTWIPFGIAVLTFSVLET